MLHYFVFICKILCWNCNAAPWHQETQNVTFLQLSQKSIVTLHGFLWEQKQVTLYRASSNTHTKDTSINVLLPFALFHLYSLAS